jgi:hypothetical protein
MSFDHKAYFFDWWAFERELLPLFRQGFSAASAQALAAFIDENVNTCRRPYDGEPLTVSWRESLEVGDPQELADFALTKYYDPSDNCGLGTDWLPLDERLAEDGRAALLGFPIGPTDNLFDPGRQGSYFHSPRSLVDALKILRSVHAPGLEQYLSFLEAAARSDRGVYVTF